MQSVHVDSVLTRELSWSPELPTQYSTSADATMNSPIGETDASMQDSPVQESQDLNEDVQMADEACATAEKRIVRSS